MNQSYQQVYKDEAAIQMQLTSMLGYKQPSISLQHKNKKQLQSNQHRVANITMRKFSKQIPQTEQMQQIDNQIRGLHNERMLRQIRQKQQRDPSLDEKSEIILLMEKRIGQYNHIIEHKHLMQEQQTEVSQKQPLNPRQIGFSKQMGKTSDQAIIDQIKKTRKLLNDAGLNQQIALNRQLARLYRSYQKHTDSKSSQLSARFSKTRAVTYRSSPSKSLTKSMKIENSPAMSKQSFMHQLQNQRSSSILTGELKECVTQDAIKKYKEIQYKKSMIHKRSTTNNQDGQAMLLKQMKAPYINKEEMDKYRVMQGKISNNHQALQIYKGRVQEAMFNQTGMSKNKSVPIQSQNKIDQQSRLRQDHFQSILTRQIRLQSWQQESAPEFYDVKVKKSKPRPIDLMKPSNKFNKLWGKRMEINLDQNESELAIRWAKKGGVTQREKNSMNKTTRNQNRGDSSHKRNASTGRSGIQQSQEDEEHYWRMCKNQKMNLLLKRK